MDPLRPLTDRRLVIVTGKGGTGKTTVTAALALAASRAGLRVLAVEVGPDSELPGLLAPGTPDPGYEGVELGAGLRAMRIEPYRALGEYLGLQLGVRALADRVLRNRAFRQLLDAAPGWRELITLGKVWHLEQMQEPEGRPRFDLILVDAPATGHGLTFLDVPRVVVSAVRMGPLRRNAALVEAMVKDRDRTLLLPVALAEELPARETEELVRRARDEIGIAVDRVVVNALTPPPLPAGLEDLPRRLRGLGTQRLPGLPPPASMAACIEHLRARSALGTRYLREIRERCGLPVVALPALPAGVEGPSELAELAAVLAPAQGTGAR